MKELMSTEIYWMKNGLAEEQIEQRGVVSLDEKEKDLLRRYAEQSRTDDGGGRVCPYPSVDQVRVPWRGGKHRDLLRISTQYVL